jgi:hypothetical protein
MDSGNPARGDNEKGADVSSVYGAPLQLAIHGQENKWWMLYVFLMFNSILLLSCAALLAVQQFNTGHKTLLYLFSVAGTLVDICWIVMAQDYIKAFNLYGDKVVAAEKLLPGALPKPLTERASQRADKSPFGTST